ncbi:MAG: dipeptidase [Acidobacteriia bacterium]|nr:dipeptidase [Terriglobia bacterium]
MKFRTACAALAVALLLALVAFSQQAPSAADEQLARKAKAIHERAITIDTHVDIPGSNYDPGVDNPRTKCNLPKMEKGGLKGVFLAVYVGQSAQLNEQSYKTAYDQAMGKFTAAHRVAEKMYPDRCALATSPADVERIAKTGKRVLMIGIENGFVIGTDLSLIKKYYDLGARYITLSHSGDNQICDSATNSRALNNGLSPLGKQVVAEMNRLGIMVDVSHIAEKSFWDVIQATKAPIIASHSGCRALCDSPRNLSDAQLQALKKNGGVIQIVALGSYLKTDSPERTQAIVKLRADVGLTQFNRQNMTEAQRAEYTKLNQIYQERLKEVDARYPPTNITDFVNHIDHAVKIVGVDHVGIGTDFDGGGGVPGFNDDTDAPNVTLELVKRGYSERDIDKIWGGNLLRVWRDVERKATKK